MPVFLEDLRRAIRPLRRAPAFTIVAALSLSLGIGANLTVFSVINALLVRPLDARDPDQLVRLGRSTRNIRFGAVSAPEYRDLARDTTTLRAVMAHQPNTAILTLDNEPRTTWIELVSANYFSGLGVPLASGRGFSADDDRAPNASPVLVISHALWRERFRSDLRAVGRTVRLNGHPFTIVGVAAPGFRGTFTGFDIQAWAPLMMQEIALRSSGSLQNRDDRFLMLIGRLKDGVSRSEARLQLGRFAPSLRGESGDTSAARLEVAPAGGVHPLIAGIVAGFLTLLQIVVLFVLLIACANLAGLLLIRSSARRRELAVRSALGASRMRLVSLILSETVLVALAGGAGGVAFAVGVGRLLERWQPPAGIPLGIRLSVDMTVLIVALILTTATVLAAGLLPALVAARQSALVELRVAGSTVGVHRSRLRSWLVGAQVAIASVLVFGSTLLVRSVQRSQAFDPGFASSNLLVASASPELLGYDDARGAAMWEDVVRRTSLVPGVRDVTLALMVPLGSRGDAMSMSPAGGALEPMMHPYNYVRAGYFEAMRIPILHGRGFTEGDRQGSRDVTVISAAMARRFFNETNAVGRTVRISDRAGQDRQAEVVGVARDIKLRSLGEAPAAIAFLPLGQWYRPDLVLHVRAQPESGVAVEQRVLEAIRTVEPNLAVTMEPITRTMGFSLIPLQVAGSVLGFSGLVGLFLAALGIFGLLGYAVTLRTREIGIRMALGARRGLVTRFVLGQGLRPVVAGAAVGLVAAFGLGGLLRGLLVGVSPLDPLTLTGVVVLLLATAAVAALVPVRRAVRIDPARVLRSDE